MIDNFMKTDLMRYRESCEDFVNEHLIIEFLHVVKKGKEAVVVCCRAHPETGREYLAVKLYREEKFRNFKQDDIYKQGRIWNTRMMRASANHTKAARMNERAIWVNTEFDALETLHDLDMNVPEPFACTYDAVAMGFVGDEGQPAPMLRQIRFQSTNEAQRCFERLLEMLALMLTNHIVHGDLSAYNILYYEGAPWIIDFPQAVDPLANPNAYEILVRDLTSITRYFAGYGLEYDPNDLAAQLWTPVFGPVIPAGESIPSRLERRGQRMG
jgi:RIO kinase 1